MSILSKVYQVLCRLTGTVSLLFPRCNFVCWLLLSIDHMGASFPPSVRLTSHTLGRAVYMYMQSPRHCNCN